MNSKLEKLNFFTYMDIVLTWLIIKILGIFLLNFSWLRNTRMTVKFDTIPTEAIVLWITRMLSVLESSSGILFILLAVLFSSLVNVLFTTVPDKLVIISIVKWSTWRNVFNLYPDFQFMWQLTNFQLKFRMQLKPHLTHLINFTELQL